MNTAGLPITWRTLLVGLDGPGRHPPVISLEEVCAFADEQLASSTALSEGAVAVAAGSDPAELRAALRQLADQEGSSDGYEVRKRRLTLLQQTMEMLPNEPLYALLALTDFWAMFDFPLESPHVVQGRGNAIAPADYFSEANYLGLVQRHRDWISAENEALRR